MLEQNIDRRGHTLERPDRNQAVQRNVEIRRAADSARGVNAIEHGVQTDPETPAVGAFPSNYAQRHRKPSSAGRPRRHSRK